MHYITYGKLKNPVKRELNF